MRIQGCTDWAGVLGLSGHAPVGLTPYLLVAAVLFTFGLISCISRKNSIGILIGVELILNAAVLNFMAFWHFGQDTAASGPLVGIIIIVLAACEAAVALAILLNLYFNFGTIEVDFVNRLKH
jgi:NADH-quinone oxidoreductase subunit K